MAVKRIGCLKACAVCLALLICLIIVWAVTNFRGNPRAGKPLAPVSHDTTRIVSPLDENGDPDYLQYVNEQQSAAVTPENNSVVLMLQATGPVLDNEPVSDEYFKRLGIAPVPEEGDYFVPLEKYVDDTIPNSGSEKYQDLLSDQEKFATRNPWDESELPELGKWFAANREVLKIVRQATKRPRFYEPFFKTPDSPTLVDNKVQMPFAHRKIARLLAISAMRHVADGNVADALVDAIALRRLARLTNQGPTLVEELLAIVFEEIATSVEFRIFQSGKCTRDQLTDYLAMIEQLKPIDGLESRLEKFERLMVLDALVHIARKRTTFAGISGGDENLEELKLLMMHTDWASAMQQINYAFDHAVVECKKEKYSARKSGLEAAEFKLGGKAHAAGTPGSIRSAFFLGSKARGQRLGIIAAYLIGPVLHPVVDAETRVQAGHILSLLALSLELYKLDHGNYPERLDELMPDYVESVPLDPFVDQPFKYVSNETSYKLYSVGPNLSDDSGLSFRDASNQDYDIPAHAIIENWNQARLESEERRRNEKVFFE